MKKYQSLRDLLSTIADPNSTGAQLASAGWKLQAHAPSAVPAMLADLDRLEAEVEQLKEKQPCP